MLQEHRCNDLHTVLTLAQNDIDQGRLCDAELRYRKALEQLPADHQLRLTLGLLYLEQHRYEAAITQIRHAIALKPDNPNAYRGLGDVLYADGQNQAAIEAYQKACDLDPTYTQALLGLGNALHQSDRYEQALAAFQKILVLLPEHPRALNNIGKTFHDMGLLDRAVDYYSQAIDIDPDYAEAHFNRSVARIAMGEYTRGWQEYEWRFQRQSSNEVYPFQLPTSRWQGQTYSGKKLLVHGEQGFGDVLQFARYLPLVKQLGGELILQAHPPLIPLLKNLQCVDRLISFDLQTPPSEPHDLHVPLLSLPSVLGTDIPKTFPYLKPDADRSAYWKQQLATNELRIGLVWTASPLNTRRNFPLKLGLEWFKIPGLKFYSLQLGPASDEIRSLGLEESIHPMGNRLRDFGETAALMDHLDLIITVDTAVAHLAGALDKPLWVLLPHIADWRWPTRLPYSPWYPGAQLFRQPQTDAWQAVGIEVARALQAWRRDHESAQALKTSLPTAPGPDADEENATGSRSPTRIRGVKAKKILLVSPLHGGSLEVMHYLNTGFQQAGHTTLFLDNSRYFLQYQEIDKRSQSPQEKEALLSRLLIRLDEQLLDCAAQFKPDVVMAIAQSPVENHTVRKLRKDGIVCAYWFVEDYRFRQYWSEIATAYDFFFVIQRDAHLKSQFAKLGYDGWHYLPLACEPSIHKPWRMKGESRRAYGCQIGFMGAPYLNRLNVFNELTDYDLKIWGEGWNEFEMPQALRACVQEGGKRTSPEESVKIYSSADMVVNLHSSPFVKGISAAGEFVNPRTYEVAGCAGFQLTDFRHELPLLFEPDREIILFNDLQELRSLIKFWLPRPQLRKQVSQRAQARAHGQHTYRHRAEEIMRIIDNG